MIICLNNPFQMPVRGGLPPSICSQIKKSLNLIREGGGGQHSSNNSETQKKSKFSGGGSGLIGNFSQICSYKNSDASPKSLS